MISMLCFKVFEVQDRNETFIYCSPGIGWHDNDISFEVAVSHNIEIGFFMQVPFSDFGLLTCTKGKNDTKMLCFLLFEAADGKEALYNYKLKDGKDRPCVWT